MSAEPQGTQLPAVIVGVASDEVSVLDATQELKPVKKKPAPVVKITQVADQVAGTVEKNIQNTVETLQGQVAGTANHITTTASAAWDAFFSALHIDNPFIKAVAEAPEGFGIVLKNGTFVPVRALHDVDDAQLVMAFLEGLSEQSRYLRFHQSMPTIRPSVAHYLANRDGYERVALIALNPKRNGAPQKTKKHDTTTTSVKSEGAMEIIAMAEYVLDDTPEVAIAVSDEWQGEGVGTQMLKLLATLSIASGHTVWRAEVLNENNDVLKILKKVGKLKKIETMYGSTTWHVHLQQKKVFS